MTLRLIFILTAIFSLTAAAFAQIDSVIGQISNSSNESFAGGISGNGRFIVFESRGNIATENPRNEDGNNEIFLFDYAQRRIFQITDTKSVVYDTSITTQVFSNIRVEITNTDPVISNDGRWIAFSSNATSATPAVPNTTNPGSFDGNAFTSPTPTPVPSVTPTPNPTATTTPTPTPSGTPTPTPTPPTNPLASDGNLEMWIYQIPTYDSVANLSNGDEIPFVNLAGGNFTQVTNTDPSQMPRPATTSTGAFVADDNHDPSINDDGNVLAFTSTRNLVPGVGNAFPAEDNDEIFTYVRGSALLSQVTKTPRGPISNPIYNKNPTISGNGLRVAFTSTGDNPIVGMTGGANPLADRNEEIFYSDLNSSAAPTGTKKQVTVTKSTNPGDPVNILDLGRRMSRDGKYIAFDSYADLANENNGTNYTSFALYLYDTAANTFRRVCARSDADSGASGGDVARYPGFTDNDISGTPATLVLETRMNIKADGTVPTTVADGLNPNMVRPSQIYSYPLNVPAATATFTRLAKFPTPTGVLALTQLMPSDSLQRMTFNLSATELGTGNFDGLSEAYYFIKPTVTTTSPLRGIRLFTGASRLPIKQFASPTPTPSPTPTVSPTPTPSPSPSPSPTASPTPSPTPVTPAAVLGMSPGMLAILDFPRPQTITARSATGSITRSPNLPFELSGVTMSINGVACGLKTVDSTHIEFVVPLAISSTAAGTTYPLIVNNNGKVLKSDITIVPSRPDIFNQAMFIGPGGRTKAFNVTNRVYTTEPFVIRTIKRRGDKLTASVLRLYLTGVANVGPLAISIRIRDQVVGSANILATNVLVDPGVYTIDFELPAALEGAGDQPIVVTVTADGVTFSSRLDDTSTKLSIL
ncbi:MAG: hypothetical protein ACKVQJ_00465 [Pyrinomonadaceae bacterium]